MSARCPHSQERKLERHRSAAGRISVSRSLAERTEAMFRSVDPWGSIAQEWKEALKNAAPQEVSAQGASEGQTSLMSDGTSHPSATAVAACPAPSAADVSQPRDISGLSLDRDKTLAPSAADTELVNNVCAGHAEAWFCGRNHLPAGFDHCIVCCFEEAWKRKDRCSEEDAHLVERLRKAAAGGYAEANVTTEQAKLLMEAADALSAKSAMQDAQPKEKP